MEMVTEKENTGMGMYIDMNMEMKLYDHEKLITFAWTCKVEMQRNEHGHFKEEKYTWK